MPFNRSEIWRLKRSAAHLNKALDCLTRANGELRPRPFDELREGLARAMKSSESVLAAMEKAIQAPVKQEPPQGKFEDLDDHREAAE